MELGFYIFFKKCIRILTFSFWNLGKYSYVNAEGNTILVKYSAGPDQGFVVENEQELKGSVEKATSEAAKKVRIQTT